MSRGLLAGPAVLAAAIVAGLTFSAASGAAPRSPKLLPDLVQSTPKTLTVVRAGARWHLGFQSAVINLGRGPLIVRGTRPSTGQPYMVARQHIRRGNGSLTGGRRIGRMRYVRSATHSHWHLSPFERYELRNLRGRTVTRARKVGFCLQDSARHPAGNNLPGSSPSPTWHNDCGAGQPDRLELFEGIAIGWMDIYARFREGQYVDITGRAGRYVLVNRVNVRRRIKERRRRNNVASLLVEITWPNGTSQAPAVRTLASCFNTARCR